MTIKFFHKPYQTLLQYFEGDPPTGRRIQVQYEQIVIFDQYLALYALSNGAISTDLDIFE